MGPPIAGKYLHKVKNQSTNQNDQVNRQKRGNNVANFTHATTFNCTNAGTSNLIIARLALIEKSILCQLLPRLVPDINVYGR